MNAALGLQAAVFGPHSSFLLGEIVLFILKQTNERTSTTKPISAPETLESKSVNKEQTSPTPHTWKNEPTQEECTGEKLEA